MERKIARLIVLVFGFSLAAAASGENLVVNPDFDDGLDGWTVSTTGNGHAAIDATRGLPSQPSAQLTSDFVTPSVSLVSTCVPIDAGDIFDLYVNLEVLAGLASVHVAAYSDGNCGAQVATSDSNAFHVHQWQTYAMTNVPVPPGTHSANVVLTAALDAAGTSPRVNFDHVEFGPAGTVVSFIDINQEGLGGTWYNPETSGQGLQFQITPATSPAADGALFGAWFTYDTEPGNTTDHQRWYSIQGGIPSGATNASFVIYQNTGGNFDAGPPTSAARVATGTLRFENCGRGTFDYAFDDGRTGSIPLQRILANVACVDTPAPTDAPSDFGLSGAWYNPATGGQGMLVEVNPTAANAFVGWYAYAESGEGSGAAGQRWFSAQAPYTAGSTAIDLALYASTGGTFDSLAGEVTTTPVGNATLTFTSCTEATLEYLFLDGDLVGRRGTIPLMRIGATPSSCSLTPQ